MTSRPPSDGQRPDSQTTATREPRRPEVADEELNDDDVDVDDRMDVASLGDGSDEDFLKVDEDECAASPFSRDVIVPPGTGNPVRDDVMPGERESRSIAFDDQVGSLVFTNQVCLSFGQTVKVSRTENVWGVGCAVCAVAVNFLNRLSLA